MARLTDLVRNIGLNLLKNLGIIKSDFRTLEAKHVIGLYVIFVQKFTGETLPLQHLKCTLSPLFRIIFVVDG